MEDDNNGGEPLPQATSANVQSISRLEVELEMMRRERRLIPVSKDFYRYVLKKEGSIEHRNAALEAFLWSFLSPGGIGPAAGVALVTLLLLVFQTMLMYRQTAISGDQKAVSDRQLLLSTRPYVSTRVESDAPTNVAAHYITIKNEGIHRVRNLHVTYLYFARVGNGWYASSLTGGLPRREALESQMEWKVKIDQFGKWLGESPPMAASFAIKDQYVVFLISFEREIDGAAYIILEPMSLVGKELYPSRDPFAGPPAHATSGPLSYRCEPGVELAYEYFRRNPFPHRYEIYNYHYLLGYQATGCLGPIEWIR